MARKRYIFDEQRVQAFVAEGRGKGSGADYRPWLRIQDVPSRGRSHRPFGIKTGRVHHLLSDGEWKCFLKFEADPEVIDIREQFPMNRLETLLIARDLGFRHPSTSDGTPYVMTIDLLVTWRHGSGQRLKPYTFKYDPDLLTPREQELLEIAAEFWRRKGLSLGILDQLFFDEELVLNYDRVRSYFDLARLAFCPTMDVPGIAGAIRRCITGRLSPTLGDLCHLIANQLGAEPRHVLAVSLHLIARGAVLVNLSQPGPLTQLPLHEFRVPAQGGA